MKTFLSLALILPAGLMLASCQSDPNYATGPMVAPVMAPTVMPTTSKPSGTLYSKTKSSTWTSPSGNSSVTKTRSTSASVSVDPNAALQTLAALGVAASVPQPGMIPGPVPGAPAGLFGKWQLTDGDNYRSCSIDLKSDESFGSYRAWTSGCFTTDLFQVGKWQQRGYEVVLLDFSGKPQASLRPTAPNRLDGYIVADGQPISMWR
ncbi:AprI/Inh family metalloprotease inhibitor [Microbaculum marinum]|uniref:AprI/Inh family metalloprotease inhibitor n=1 Tax=Microbaculum marinum TaxID=1764581 RepID=A0AAW9RE85_9HYPH